MFDSSKFSDHPHGTRDQHIDKLMSRNTIGDILPLFDSVGIKHAIKYSFKL